jgi:phosphatidylinositol alpha-1,6-mannosyltransferase
MAARSAAAPPRPVARRVLGLFPTVGPDTVGGVQASGRVAWSALVADARRGPGGTADLFCGRHGPDGLPVVRLTRPRAVLRAATGRWRADLVLVWHLGLLRLLPLLRVPRARVALFLHGIEAWRRPGPLTRRLLSRVDLVLSNSEHTWARCVGVHPEWRAVPQATVHLGLGAPAGGPVARPDPAPTALMLGRLLRAEDYKGHQEVIAAWPRVLARVPAARLWVAGDGDARPGLERLAARGPARDHIRFWGEVSETDKQALLARSRCLLLPSRGEGFGLVYLEAMRLGRPCLVSTLDAGREVVDPPVAGLAADPRQADGLAAAAARLLTAGPAWDAWSARARRRYEERFTAAHFGRRLVEALAALDDPAAPVGAAGQRGGAPRRGAGAGRPGAGEGR